MKVQAAQILAAAAAGNIALANAMGDGRLPIDTGAIIAPGQIALANSSRFVETYFDEPLTTYAVGYADSADLQGDLEFFAPAVQTSRRFTYKTQTNAEEFYSETDDVRAIGSDFKKVEYTGSEVEAKTYNKGLMVIVDRDEAAPGWEQRAVRMLTDRLMRNDLRRAITLLAAAGVNTAKTWDTTALKDPDQDVLTDLVTGADLSGISLNRVGYGKTAWQKRVLSHRAQDTAGGYASAAMSPEQVAAFLGVDQVRVSSARYANAAATKAQIVNNLALMFYAESGGGLEDASNIKRFVSPVEGGGLVRVYMQELGPKLIAVSVEHYSNIAITSTLGIRKFTVS